MTEKELISVFVPLLEKALSSVEIDIPVIQLNQPTMQPRSEDGDAVYFSFLIDDVFGSAQRTLTFDQDAELFKEKSTQQYVSIMQISVLYPKNPSKPKPMTPKDLAQYLSARLATSSYLKSIRDGGAGITRITRVRSNWFENDKRQFENMPNFDLYITHKGSITDEVQQVSSAELNIHRI